MAASSGTVLSPMTESASSHPEPVVTGSASGKRQLAARTIWLLGIGWLLVLVSLIAHSARLGVWRASFGGAPTDGRLSLQSSDSSTNQAQLASQRFCDALAENPASVPSELALQIEAELDRDARRVLGAALVRQAEALLRQRRDSAAQGFESAKLQWIAGECYLAAGSGFGELGENFELLERGSEHCIYAAIAAKRQGREDAALEWFSRADETCRMMLDTPEIEGSDLARRLSEKRKRISSELEAVPAPGARRSSKGNEV